MEERCKIYKKNQTLAVLMRPARRRERGEYMLCLLDSSARRDGSKDPMMLWEWCLLAATRRPQDDDGRSRRRWMDDDPLVFWILIRIFKLWISIVWTGLVGQWRWVTHGERKRTLVVLILLSLFVSPLFPYPSPDNDSTISPVSFSF